MKRRRLTVSYTPAESRSARVPRRSLRPIPFLRLRGRWLDEAGFTIGRPVRVVVSHGLISLEVLDDEQG